VRAERAWLVAAAVLAAASLGLPWSGQLVGAASPARIAVVAALVLGAVGLRTGRDLLVRAAAGAGLVGVLLGGPDPAPGRLALAAAVVCLVLGCRAGRRPVLPTGRVRSPAG
jgi:hypothetical protein